MAALPACGHVLSARAIKQVTLTACPAPYASPPPLSLPPPPPPNGRPTHHTYANTHSVPINLEMRTSLRSLKQIGSNNKKIAPSQR